MDFATWWEENGNDGHGERVFAKKAFNAATIIERVACATVCDSNVQPLERYEGQWVAGKTARDCANSIRTRANV